MREAATNPAGRVSRRLVRWGSGLVAAGTLVWWLSEGARPALSFLVGGGWGGAYLLLLWRAVASLLQPRPAVSPAGVVLGFFLRLMLIPLGLYAMIRFFLLSLPAVVFGFLASNGSLLVVAILEGIRQSRHHRHRSS